MIGCGIVQAHYAFKNISEKSETTVKYFIAMLSSTADCIIFLYLGMEVLSLKDSEPEVWYPGFIMWTLVLCLIVRSGMNIIIVLNIVRILIGTYFRFIGVYIFTGIVNRFSFFYE